MPNTAAIVGIPGPVLDRHTAILLRDTRPAGVILFGRNVQDKPQLQALTTALRAVLPPEAVVIVDQEGGRVARLRPPHWHAHPPAGCLGALYETNQPAGLRAAWITGALIGADCAEAGFDVVCAPVLDRRLDGYHDVVGDRGFSDDPDSVAELGRAVAEGLLAAGIQPVMKHLPGHGRACVDSHLSLPVVQDNVPADLAPFIRNAGLPWAMTAHILFPDWDSSHPATLSATVIADIIRGTIDFAGVLVSDDLAMQALSGTPAERAVRALAAGCDLAMYCAGDHDSTALMLAACGPVGQDAATRLQAARALALRCRISLDSGLLAAERDELLR